MRVKWGIMDQDLSMFGFKDNAVLLDCRTIESKAYKINNLKSFLIMTLKAIIKREEPLIIGFKVKIINCLCLETDSFVFYYFLSNLGEFNLTYCTQKC